MNGYLSSVNSGRFYLIVATALAVMTVGILCSLFCRIFFLKKYLDKLKSAPKKDKL